MERKPHFYLSETLVFASTFYHNIGFFLQPFLAIILSHFMVNLCETYQFCDLFKLQLGSKWQPQSPKWRQQPEQLAKDGGEFGFLEPTRVQASLVIDCH